MRTSFRKKAKKRNRLFFLSPALAHETANEDKFPLKNKSQNVRMQHFSVCVCDDHFRCWSGDVEDALHVVVLRQCHLRHQRLPLAPAVGGVAHPEQVGGRGGAAHLLPVAGVDPEGEP